MTMEPWGLFKTSFRMFYILPPLSPSAAAKTESVSSVEQLRFFSRAPCVPKTLLGAMANAVVKNITTFASNPQPPSDVRGLCVQKTTKGNATWPFPLSVVHWNKASRCPRFIQRLCSYAIVLWILHFYPLSHFAMLFFSDGLWLDPLLKDLLIHNYNMIQPGLYFELENSIVPDMFCHGLFLKGVGKLEVGPGIRAILACALW